MKVLIVGGAIYGGIVAVDEVLGAVAKVVASLPSDLAATQTPSA